MCLQVTRYPEVPAAGDQLRTAPLSVVFRAAKPVTLGGSTEGEKDRRMNF